MNYFNPSKLGQINPYSAGYTTILKLNGYDRSLALFITNINLPIDDSAHLLEVGCGSGILGLTLLKKYPQTTILTTDIKPSHLKKITRRYLLNNVSKDRFRTGICNASELRTVTANNLSKEKLIDSSFDLIVFGAVFGHVNDYKQTLSTAMKLLKPKGTILILEMHDSFISKIVSFIYNYKRLSISKMKKFLIDQEDTNSIEEIKLNIKYFPANLTRTALVITKKPTSLLHITYQKH